MSACNRKISVIGRYVGLPVAAVFGTMDRGREGCKSAAGQETVSRRHQLAAAVTVTCK